MSNVVKKAQHYAKYPVHQCLVPQNLFADGMGTVLFVRKTSFGEVAVSSFLLDTFCKGVKDAYFKTMDEYEFETRAKPQMEELGCQSDFIEVSPAYARKLVEDMVSYAAAVDIKPHPDYLKAKGIFGDVDVRECDTDFEFGYEGKPYYMPGPHESHSDIQQTMAKLTDCCGEGDFHFITPVDQMLAMDYPEFEQDIGGDIIEGEVLR